MFVNPCFYFEELFPAVAPGEEVALPDEAVQPADTAAVPLGAGEIREAAGAACCQ